jgi:mRNA-degrading endonuclease RelE of RelBE toxin-antitoxin system
LTYEVRLDRAARRYFERLDRRTQTRVANLLEQLGSQPRDRELSKPLANARGQRSARLGGLRIIFSINEQEQVLRVSRIAPRGQVYRGLE